MLLGVLNHQLTSLSSKCVSLVVMSEHVHALIWLPETGQVGRFVHGWKRMLSFNIRKWFRDNDIQYFQNVEMGDRFWQPKYYSFSVYSRRKLEEKLKHRTRSPGV